MNQTSDLTQPARENQVDTHAGKKGLWTGLKLVYRHEKLTVFMLS